MRAQANFIEYTPFFLILLVGYIYIWRKGVLDWGPAVVRRRREIEGQRERLTHVERALARRPVQPIAPALGEGRSLHAARDGAPRAAPESTYRGKTAAPAAAIAC